MEHWTFWEWVAYSGLWIASILLAIDGGLRLYPVAADRSLVQTIVRSPWFAFAPLTLVVVSTIILLANLFLHPASDAALLDKARLDVARVEPNPPTASDNNGLRVNVYTINTSDVVISGMTDNYRFEYPDRLLTKDEDDRLMKSVLAGTPEPPYAGVEISPHQNGPWYTARDTKFTVEEWNEILSGKKLAYLFVAMKYLAGSRTRVTEYCIIFFFGISIIFAVRE